MWKILYKILRNVCTEFHCNRKLHGFSRRCFRMEWSVYQNEKIFRTINLIIFCYSISFKIYTFIKWPINFYEMTLHCTVTGSSFSIISTLISRLIFSPFLNFLLLLVIYLATFLTNNRPESYFKRFVENKQVDLFSLSFENLSNCKIKEGLV